MEDTNHAKTYKIIDVYRVRPGQGCCSFCERTLEATIGGIVAFLADAETGTVMMVEKLEMLEDEYNNMDEYDGP